MLSSAPKFSTDDFEVLNISQDFAIICRKGIAMLLSRAWIAILFLALPWWTSAAAVCPELFYKLRPLAECMNDCRITKPIEANSYYFPQNQKSFAAYIYKIKVRVPDQPPHDIEIVVPKWKPEEVHRVTQGIVASVMELPPTLLSSTHTIRMNALANYQDDIWRSRYRGFTESWGTADNGVIDLYPTSFHQMANMDVTVRDFFRHEHSHNIARRLFGSVEPPPEYAQISVFDPYIASEYARNSVAEDFAETLAIYLRTRGGALDPTQRQNFPNRFSYFDRLFGNNEAPAYTSQQAARMAAHPIALSAREKATVSEITEIVVREIIQKNNWKHWQLKKTSAGLVLISSGLGIGYYFSESGQAPAPPQK